MEPRESKLKIFKYNAILSMIFFISSTLVFSSAIDNFSLRDYTISDISKFLTKRQLSYFNALFFIKCLMDFLFVAYLIQFFRIKAYSPTALFLLLAVISFGALGFFPISENRFGHILVASTMFISFTFSEISLARLIGDDKFLYLTKNLVAIQIISVGLFFSWGNFNGVFELFYMITAFLWLMILIKNYLR